MKKKSSLILAAAAAAGIYSAVNGKGIFNRMRFKNQHDAVARYVESNYPNAFYTPITAAGNGWATTIIPRRKKPRIFLYITRSDNNTYVFHETNVREK